MPRMIDPDKYWYGKGFDDALLKIRPRNRMKHYLRGYRDGKHYEEVREKYKDKPTSQSQNPGYGKAFTFHGGFTSKILARRREKEVPGSFIQEKDGRYYVLKPKKIGSRKNAAPVLIYERCLRIEAIKMHHHAYGGKSTPSGQKYFHDFTTRNARIYGLPNGDLLIKSK